MFSAATIACDDMGVEQGSKQIALKLSTYFTDQTDRMRGSGDREIAKWNSSGTQEGLDRHRSPPRFIAVKWTRARDVAQADYFRVVALTKHWRDEGRRSAASSMARWAVTRRALFE
jgi:hypothetical protein